MNEPNTPSKTPAGIERGRKYRFVVKSAEEAITTLRERLGSEAKVLSVRQLDGEGTYKVSYEALARAAGIKNVFTVNPVREKALFKEILAQALNKDELSVIIARSPCILAAGRIAAWEKEQKASAAKAPTAPGEPGGGGCGCGCGCQS